MSTRAAEGRGRRAYPTYEQEARALSLQIAGAAGAVRPAPVVPGGAPVPITSTPGDIAIAAALARHFADGKVTGPLIDDLPPSERTPLIRMESTELSGALAAGGAKGPYGPWTASAFGGDAPSVNLWVQRGLVPPLPGNWNSMSGAARQAWLRANGPYFSGLSCGSAGCTFVKATGTGTRSIPQALLPKSEVGADRPLPPWYRAGRRPGPPDPGRRRRAHRWKRDPDRRAPR